MFERFHHGLLERPLVGILSVIVASTAVWSPPAAAAQPSASFQFGVFRLYFAEPTAEVEALNAQAFEKFQERDYDAAIELFEQAYALNPEPNYLFNIGRVYEEKGDVQLAIDHYERFLEEPGIEPEARERALKRLRMLQAIVAETKVATPKGKPEPEGVEPGPPGSPDDEDKPKREVPAIRKAGFIMLGVGGGLLVVGGALGGAALAVQKQLDETKGYEPRADLSTSGKGLSLSADVMFIAGGTVALVGGILALASLRKKRTGSQRATIRPAWAPSRGGFVVEGRF